MQCNKYVQRNSPILKMSTLLNYMTHIECKRFKYNSKAFTEYIRTNVTKKACTLESWSDDEDNAQNGANPSLNYAL